LTWPNRAILCADGKPRHGLTLNAQKTSTEEWWLNWADTEAHAHDGCGPHYVAGRTTTVEYSEWQAVT
jgi:hypothetical protein